MTFQETGVKEQLTWQQLHQQLLPALGKLATLATEELGAYLQRKRNRALKVALQELDQKAGMSLK